MEINDQIVFTMTIALLGVGLYWLLKDRWAVSLEISRRLLIKLPLTTDEEAARDFDRMVQAGGVTVREGGESEIRSIQDVLNTENIHAVGMNSSRPSSSLPDFLGSTSVANACLQFFSVGGILAVLESAKLPKDLSAFTIHQAHAHLEISPFSGCILVGFIGKDVQGDRPELKYTTHGIKLTAVLIDDQNLEISAIVFDAKGAKRSLELL